MKLICHMLLAGGLLFGGCASSQDSKSNVLFVITHTINSKRTTMYTFQDHSYFILIDKQSVEYRGSFEATEFAALGPHVSQAALTRLGSEMSRQSSNCDLTNDPRTYFLDSIPSSGCLLPSEFTDQEALEDFEYIVGVFDQKTAEYGIQ